MATVGIKLVTLAMVDKNQQILKGDDGLSETGIVPVTDEMLGTKTANITDIQVAGTVEYGNNVPVYISNPTGTPQVALEFNNLPFDILQKATGRTLVDGGWVETGEKPHIALLVQSQTIDRLNNVWYAFGNGQLIQASANNGTDTNAETMADDALTYQSLSTKAFSGKPIKIFSDLDDTFDEAKMMAATFGGYAATATVTPSTGE